MNCAPTVQAMTAVCMCMDVCVFVCEHTCVSAHGCVGVFKVDTHVCMYVCESIYRHMCGLMYAYLHTCLCVCVNTCMGIWTDKHVDMCRYG